MSVTPEVPIAGRDVSFSLAGLPPWELVTFTFVDPQNIPVPWVTAEDVNVVGFDGNEATTIKMFPTTSGELEWSRYGALDVAGDWSVDIRISDQVDSAAYTLKNLELNDVITVSQGTILTEHPAPDFIIYYSDLVPSSLVVDLQEHLIDTRLLLEELLQTEIAKVPDIYLAGDRDLMALMSVVTGINLGFEDGYYTNFGQRSGIYMRTDLLDTEVRRLLTHEFIHHVFNSLAEGQEQPAWLAEGLSKYYEFNTALLGPRPDATKLRLLVATDRARAAAQQGALFSFADLDSQANWNSRTDENEISLQYAQAYMAVRFLNETYGPLTGKALVEMIGRGFDLPESLSTVTGLDLGLFETLFSRWLEDWEDQEREPVAEYLVQLDSVLAGESANSVQRAENIANPMNTSESINSRALLVSSTEDLLSTWEALSPPQRAETLHQEAGEHLSRVLEWLTLELRAAQAQDGAFQNAANDMIQELIARDFTLKSNMDNLRFILNIPT